jgi:hypothetical protein
MLAKPMFLSWLGFLRLGYSRRLQAEDWDVFSMNGSVA